MCTLLAAKANCDRESWLLNNTERHTVHGRWAHHASTTHDSNEGEAWEFTGCSIIKKRVGRKGFLKLRSFLAEFRETLSSASERVLDFLAKKTP